MTKYTVTCVDCHEERMVNMRGYTLPERCMACLVKVRRAAIARIIAEKREGDRRRGN